MIDATVLFSFFAVYNRASSESAEIKQNVWTTTDDDDDDDDDPIFGPGFGGRVDRAAVAHAVGLVEKATGISLGGGGGRSDSGGGGGGGKVVSDAMRVFI